jgi:putative transposase
MPRQRRHAPPDSVLHLVNRANERRLLFEAPGDYDAFLEILSWAKARCPVRLLAYCLMPNHWHFIVSPPEHAAIPRFMHRVCTTHAVRLRRATGSVGLGHVYQQRYSASLIDSEAYYYTTLRYVEANPLRAGLVDRAQRWAWSSLSERLGRDRGLVDESPLPLPPNWLDLVNEPLPAEPLLTIRRASRRQGAELHGRG